MKKMTLTVLSWILLYTFNSTAQVSPDIEWMTLKTKHFDLIYDAKQSQLAKTYASRLEFIYDTLKPVLISLPEKTVVIINDNTDSPNGYATRVPYPTIMTYPVLPSPGDSISQYGDWIYELLLHEYVHILSFEPVTGIAKPLRSVFGTIITPNMLLPKWWLEGIAVDFETRYSKHGRLRSHYQDATLRELVRSESWNDFKIDEANEQTLPSWPFGARPYLFGSLMMSHIISQTSVEFMNELLQRYGGRAPYFITAPIEEKFNSDYSILFSNLKKDIQNRVETQIKQLSEAPETTTQIFLTKDGESEAPQISPNGQYLVLSVVSQVGDRSIRIFDRGNENRSFDATKDLFKSTDDTVDEHAISNVSMPSLECQDAPPGGAIGRISWFPDSKKFIFDKVASETPYKKTSELYIYDIASGKSKKMTSGLRAREPHVSPNNTTIAFVQLSAMNTTLNVSDAEFKNVKIVYKPQTYFRISFPTFVSNEDIVFSERDLNGNETLKLINLKTGAAEPLELKGLNNPLFLSQEGKELLLSAEKNGLNQVYSIDLPLNKNLNPKRLTNVYSLSTKATRDPRTQEVYFSKMTHKGFQVATFKPEIKSAQSPQIGLLFEDRYPPLISPTKIADLSELSYTIENYSASEYLLPSYWLPTFYFDSTGYGTQAMTSGSDPLGKHSYSVQAGYDNVTSSRSLAGVYVNSTTAVTYSLSGATQLMTSSVSGTNYSVNQGTIMGQYPLWSLSQNLIFGTGLTQSQIQSTVIRRKFGAILHLNYNSISQSPNHYTATSGWASDFKYTYYNPDWADYGFEKTNLTLTSYFSKWLPEGHAIKTEFHGLYTPNSLSVLDATHSQSYPYLANLLFDGFVIRGYEYDHFIFKNGANLSLEYRFPLQELKEGFGTKPLFIRRLHGAVVADAITVDGLKLNPELRTYSKTPMNQYYYSAGIEAKMDITLGYYFPMSWVLGYYYRSDYNNGNQSPTTAFLGVQI